MNCTSLRGVCYRARRMRHALPLCLLLVALPSCGDDNPNGSGSGSSRASATQAVTAAPEPVKAKSMPPLLVDAEGPYIGVERVKMTEPNAAEKLAKLCKDLP